MCFLIIFHLGQGTLELRRETSVMQTSDTFVFLTSLKKNISLFGWELLLRTFSIQSIIKFLENRDQNSLDARSFSAIFD